MASLSGTTYEEIQKEVHAHLKLHASEDYKQLEMNPDAMKKVEAAIKGTYHHVDTMLKNADSLENALRHLPDDHKELIKTTFRLQSFDVDSQYQPHKRVVDLKFASLTETPLTCVPSKVQVDSSNHEEHRVLFVARIIFEIIVLVLNLVGIKLTPSSKATSKAIDCISKVVSAHAKIFSDIEKMADAAKAQNLKQVAASIVACIVDLFRIVGNQLLDIIRLILLDMSTFERMISTAQVLCFIVTTIMSAGASVIAKVIQWLLSATAFFKKLTHLHEFKSYQLK